MSKMYLALNRELIRYRLPAVIIFSVVLVCISGFGLKWQKSYVSEAVLSVSEENLVKPLSLGIHAENGGSDLLRDKVYSQELIENVVSRLNPTTSSLKKGELSAIANLISSRITLKPSETRKNDFIISYSNADPELSFHTMTVLIDEFIAFHESSKREESVTVYEFISKQAETYKELLAGAARKIEEFRSRGLDLSEAAVKQRIRELDSEIKSLRLALKKDRSQIEKIEMNSSATANSFDGESKASLLRSQKEDLEKRLSSLRVQFQDSYPDIITIKEQVAELDKLINNSIEQNDSPTRYKEPERLKKKIETDINSKEQRLVNLVSLLEAERQKAKVVASNRARLDELTNDYDAIQADYDEIRSQKDSAEQAIAITKAGHGLSYRVVDAPVFPMKPAGLTFEHFAMAAPILAISVPIFLILLLIFLDPRLRTANKLEKNLNGHADLIGVASHCYTPIANRLLRKDIFTLFLIGLTMCCVYVYIVFLGLFGHDAVLPFWLS